MCCYKILVQKIQKPVPTFFFKRSTKQSVILELGIRLFFLFSIGITVFSNKSVTNLLAIIIMHRHINMSL